MKTLKRISLIITAAALAVSCGFFGAFDNPVDPLSEAWQGYLSLSITAMGVGEKYVLATAAGGKVYAWGEDDSTGRLGAGENAGSECTPVAVQDLEDAAAVACGRNHSLAVDTGGNLWGWGSNEFHQLGTYASGGVLPQEGIYEPVLLKDDIAAAGAGLYFSAAVNSEGIVSVWGVLGLSEDYGEYSAELELSVPEYLSLPGTRTAADLVCGSDSIVVLASDGTVWQWGYIDSTMHDVFEQVMGPVNVEHISGYGDVFNAAETGGTLWTWGDYDTYLWGGYGYNGDLTEVPVTATGFSSVASGSGFGLALTDTGELYGWGKNTCGVLGLPYWMFNLEEPFRVDPLYPDFDFSGASLYAGDDHAFVYLPGGSLLPRGNNDEGELGVGKRYAPTTSLDRYRVTFSETDIQVVDAAGGDGFGAALDSGGHIWVWGRNDDGRLGLGDTAFRAEPVKVSSGPVITDIAAGWNFSAAKDEDGKLWGSGDNSYGQLATGDTTDSSVPVSMLAAVDMFDCGFDHVLAVQDDGDEQQLYAWGDNEFGQLGTGDTAGRTTPTEIAGIDTVVTAVSCCGENSMALDENGHVWVWGNNAYGQVGDGSTDSRTTPYMLPESRFDGYAVSAIEAGYKSCFAITSDGRLWGWGGPYYNLGYSESDDSPGTIFPVVLMDENVIAVAVSKIPYNDSQRLVILTGDDQVYVYACSQTLVFYEEGDRVYDAQGYETDIRYSDIWSGRNLSVIEGGEGHFFLVDENGTLYAF